ncbi:TIGR04282 family arsenosugar biosynthesis glycosyltransferase [Crocosphaera sp. UHCC 0190]|uniref:TIGR04282 family arsenosugar biosynthesis glycosyltransferase n=1 Tax=Crocosphaera sp. UHCC 0190 TaxID=3110246 RepID=UPI002B21957A|nr:TIGR04282 family arsenosugar biosynthesis glycosyltransferase [Crocosphaera sp. UHCC 0190]MEA5511470.1 TIGR04282 family arsenosugar biosynthesis glycosyltransferase [Crocosphaera sp. UHCC 0190]
MSQHKLSSNHCLIIFTRYPEPGKTKTRLIPVLGAEGAANLQKQLTEHTVKQAKKLLNNLAISIYYTGKNKELMQAWLGDNLSYYSQARGDLGNRMNMAFIESFKLGFSKAVIIGIDCPDLNINILKNAFNYLENHDLVLGEAADGGYYLIGLKRVIPELFREILWGTSEVLSMTTNIADGLNLSYYLLPVLSDIDRPEDLYIWEKYK